MIRVLHVVCDLSGGGAERMVLDLCRLAGPDIEARVAAIHQGGELAGAYDAAGVDVFAAGRRRGTFGALATLRVARVARWADIVHTHLWAGDTWGRLGGWLARRPVVSTQHNTQLEPGWRGRMSLALHARSAAVVAVSEAVAGQLHGVSRVRVIPNGVDLDRFPPQAPPRGRPRVLFLGRLAYQKGPDVLLRAMAAPGLRRVPLDLVGDGPLRPRLEALARSLGVDARFHGWRADPSRWLRAAHVVSMPSRWEGFGLSAVETMASARPLVCSDVPGLDEVVGGAAVRTPVGDPEPLSRALVRALASPDRGRVRLGLRRVEMFDIHTTVAEHERMYRELASSTTVQ